jgi:hypothetical protein
MSPNDDAPPPSADPDLEPLSPDDEATMLAEIERALDPYRAMTPPKVLAAMRENMERAARTHPHPRQLLRGFSARTPRVVSGDAAIDGAESDSPKAEGKEGA